MTQMRYVTAVVLLFLSVQVNPADDNEVVFASLQEMQRVVLACDDFVKYLKDFEKKDTNKVKKIKRYCYFMGRCNYFCKQKCSRVLPVKPIVDVNDVKENLLTTITAIFDVQKILNSGLNLKG